jgi:hypothetical protein
MQNTKRQYFCESSAYPETTETRNQNQSECPTVVNDKSTIQYNESSLGYSALSPKDQSKYPIYNDEKSQLDDVHYGRGVKNEIPTYREDHFKDFGEMDISQVKREKVIVKPKQSSIDGE